MTNNELCIAIENKRNILTILKSELTDATQIARIDEAIETFQATLIHLDSLLALPLSIRAYNTLMRNGIESISKLTSMKPDNISALEGMSEDMANEVVGVIKAR